MATVAFFDRQARTPFERVGSDCAPAALRALDVQTGRWALQQRPVSSTPQLTYARELHALQRRYGTVLTDRLRARPLLLRRHAVGHESWPELPDEHTHGDDEVRVVLEGGARFVLRAPGAGGWAVIECAAGDWVALPAGLPHAFKSSPAHGVDMLRLFSRPRGWVAERTGAAVPRDLLCWDQPLPSPTPVLALAA
jgi:1,2-dihydroxy-3-keto-5-methylthiopentene dioxygenase